MKQWELKFMEFWEGAILVVGGIWLVGKVSRNSPSHPVTAAQAATATPIQAAGNTIGTQQDGSPALVWGEPLAPPTPPLPAHPNIMTTTLPATHVAAGPMIVSHLNPIQSPMRFNPIPTVPKMMPPAPARVTPYVNRTRVGGRFYDL